MQPIDNLEFNKQPLLTIAIPTYNRASYLTLCLKRINEEITNLNELQRCLVEVYISDNASSDETPDVIAQYQGTQATNFKTIRNSENIGVDCNVTQCYESASTPYIWIIGDDDVLLPGGLGKVLDTLSNQEVDMLYVNNYWFMDSYLDNVHSFMPEQLGIAHYSDALPFARRTNVMLTFISSLIVRTGIGLNYRKELVETNLIQLSWILPLLREGKNFAIIENWTIAAKGGNSGGYSLVKVFGENLKRITNTILDKKPKVAKVIQNGTIIKFFPSFIIAFRKKNSPFTDKDIATGLKQAYFDNWRYYIFLVPLIKMPLFLASRYNKILYLSNRLIGNYCI